MKCNLPILKIASAVRVKLVSIVDSILAAKRRDPGADTTAWQREIDRLVYALYGLTPDEIKLVEESNH